MKLSILLAATALIAAPAPFLAAQTPAHAAAAHARLATILTNYEAYLRRIDPVTAGMEGDDEALARLSDSSRAFELAQRAPLTEFLARLTAIDAATLSPADRINHAFLSGVLRHRIAG